MGRKITGLGYNLSGAYCIENLINNKKYVGCSVDIKKRWIVHKSKLINSKHDNKRLQADFDKYGLENFSIYILKICSKETFEEIEKHYIKLYKTYNDLEGYNYTTGGKGLWGYHHTEENKKIIGKIQIGNKNFVGKKLSQKHRDALLSSKIGYIISEETRQKMSAWQTGRKLPESTLKKLSISRFGKKRKNSSSKYRGVCWSTKDRRWQANIRVNKKVIYLGQYLNEIDAAKAYNEALLYYYKKPEFLNVL